MKPHSPSLLEIVEQKLIPWMTQEGEKRLIVAPLTLADAVPGDGLRFIPRPFRGKREPRRGFSLSGIQAIWRKDFLLEAYHPLLFFVLDGEVEYRCSDYVLLAPAGSVVFVPAGIPRADGYEDLGVALGDNPKRFCNTILFHERCENLGIWLNFDRGNRHYRSENDVLSLIVNAQLPRILNLIQEELAGGAENYVPISVHYLRIFLYCVQRELRTGRGLYLGQRERSEDLALPRYDPIVLARQYIHERLYEHLTIEKVARHARLSRTQFIQRFRQETGETFNGYVTRCRLEQAKNLLENTTLTIRFISARLGYRSDVHFYRVFLKHEGLTPSAYRAKYQNND